MKDFFRKNGKKLTAVLCSLTLVISCFQGIGSLMPEVKASDNTYTELTFSDFGIADQSFNSTNVGVTGKPSTDIKSLDKTIITGKITLSSHSDEHILIGGAEGASDYYASSPGIIISQSEGGQLLIRAQYDGNKGTDTILFNEEAPVSKGFNMLGDTITFRIQLDYVDEDVVVTMTMDNGTVSVIDSATLAGIASKMTTNMAFNPWLSSCSIASVVNYTEVTFSDFGIDNQSLTSTTTGVKGTLPSTKTSWNKTIFTGKLQVTKNIGTHFIFGGSNTAGDYYADSQGLILEYRTDGQLLLRWQNSSSSKGAEHLLFDDNLLTSQGFNMLEDELVFRIQFDYFGEDVTVSVTLDNGEVSATDKATFTGIASSMTTNMVFNPWLSDCSIASVVNYMKVTFSDFGIGNQSFTGTTTGVKGTLPSTKTSWNKTIFTGELQVTNHIGTHFIFGGSNTAGDYNADSQGLILEYRTDGQLLLRWQNSSSSKGAEHLLFDDNLLTSQGFNMLEDELVFRIQFDYFGEDVTVSVTLDNGEVSATDKATFTGIASSMTTNMVFNPWLSDCKIGSVNISEDPEEPVAVERTLTFSDFGIDDASYNGGNYSALTGTAPADVETLDKVTFIGKIGVTTNVDASLFFGGDYVNNAYQDDSYGIGFFNAAGELWLRYRWAGTTSKEIRIISAANLSEQGLSLVGDELIWKVRFDYTDNDVKVTVTLQQGENTVSGECILEGIADTLTTDMAFNPWGSTCKISSVDTGEEPEDPEEPVAIERTLTFSDFGIGDQSWNGGNYTDYKGTAPTDVLSLDKVTFVGKIQVTTHVDEALFFGGDYSDKAYNGSAYGIGFYNVAGNLDIRSNTTGTENKPGYIITEAAMSEQGISLIGEELLWKVRFDYVGSDVKVTVTLVQGNKSVTGEKTLSGISEVLTTNMAFNPWGSSCSITSYVEYRKLTFSDFGIEDQSWNGGNYTDYKGTAPLDVLSLNRVIFEGKIQVTTHVDEALFFGGDYSDKAYNGSAYGIGFYNVSGNLDIRSNTTGTENKPGYIITEAAMSEQGISLIGEELLWKVRFDYVGSDVKVTVTLVQGDKSVTGEKTLSGIAESLTTNMAFNPYGSSCSITSYVVYRELTFSDFGIEDQSWSGGNYTDYKGTAPTDVLSLNRVIFEGKIQVTTHVDEALFFGGDYSDGAYYGSAYGIGLYNVEGNLDIRSKTAGNENKPGYIITKATLSEQGISLIGEELLWKVRFDYVGSDVKVTVTLVQGDKSVTGEKTLSGIAESLTTNMAFNPYGSSCKISSVDSSEEPEEPGVVGCTLTFSDCGIEDAEFSRSNTGKYIGKFPESVKSLDGVTFKGMFAFTYYNDPNLMIGGEAEHYGEDKTRGIMLIKQGDGIGLRCYIYQDGVRTYKSEAVVYTMAEMEEAGITFTNQPLLVTMSFEYTGDSKENVVVSLDVSNGVNSLTGKTVTFENVTTDLTTNVVFNSQSSAGKIASVSSEKELVKKSYNLTDGAYLFDTAGHITAINGALTDRGAELKKAGTYTLMGVVDGVVSTRTVSLYALGDMDLSAVINDDGNVTNTITSKDLVIIKKCIADESKYTEAHLKAADLSNDNFIDEDDAKAMRKVLVGEIALDEYYPAAMSYEYLGGDEVMPLSGYFGPYAKDGMNYLTEEIYSALSDANINLVVSSSQDYIDGVYAGEDFNGAQAVKKALQLSEEYKMGMYVLNSDLNFIYATGETATNNEVGNQYGKTYNVMERERHITSGAEAANYLANYSCFDSYLGTMVRDEPCTATFPATNEALLDSGNRLEWYSDVASRLNSYSNSFGYLNAQCYSGRNKDNPSLNIGGKISEDWEDRSSVALYTDYLNEILTTTKIPVLSYDNYMYGKGVDGNKRSARDANTWIVNLDTVRTVAKDNRTGKEVPFWTQVAAGGYFDGDSTTISSTDDIMTQAQFNWQVNVPLAFGAKGITYFPLIQPTDFANAGDLDNNLTRNGMINTEYETTKWYTYAKELNEQITSVDHVLMKADNKGIIISNGTDSYAYDNMVGISFQQTGSNWFRPYSVKDYTLKAYKETDPQGRVTNFTSSNTEYGAIAGVFSYQGKTAYYVVNWSDVTTGTDTVTLTFDKATNYTVIQNAKETAKSGDTCQLSLAAGEGVLVVLNDNSSVEDLVDFVVEVESGKEPVVLQLTDPQIIDSAQDRTKRLSDTETAYWATDQVEERCYSYIQETVEETKPDLILLTGDIIYGEFDDNGTALQSFVKFMDSFGIPWAPVWGNHDNESAKGVDWQCEQFENAQYCLFKQRELTGNGNYTVGLVQDGVLKRVFFMLDSNGCASASQESLANGHTERGVGFGEDQIQWYTKTAKRISAKSPSTKITFAFHIQLQVFQDAYEKYGESLPINIDLLENKEQSDFGYLGRTLKTPWDADYSVWNGLKELGVDSILVGHEHCNSASIVYEGIRLQFGQKSSTYDRANFMAADGSIIGGICEDWKTIPKTPLVGGTVMPLSDDGSITNPYIYLCGNNDGDSGEEGAVNGLQYGSDLSSDDAISVTASQIGDKNAWRCVANSQGRVYVATDLLKNKSTFTFSVYLPAESTAGLSLSGNPEFGIRVKPEGIDDSLDGAEDGYFRYGTSENFTATKLITGQWQTFTIDISQFKEQCTEFGFTIASGNTIYLKDITIE